jgi:hypothetical protein
LEQKTKRHQERSYAETGNRHNNITFPSLWLKVTRKLGELKGAMLLHRGCDNAFKKSPIHLTKFLHIINAKLKNGFSFPCPLPNRKKDCIPIDCADPEAAQPFLPRGDLNLICARKILTNLLPTHFEPMH